MRAGRPIATNQGAILSSEYAPKMGSAGSKNNTASTGIAKIRYVRITLHVGQSAEFIILVTLNLLLVHIRHRFELSFKVRLRIFASLDK